MADFCGNAYIPVPIPIVEDQIGMIHDSVGCRGHQRISYQEIWFTNKDCIAVEYNEGNESVTNKKRYGTKVSCEQGGNRKAKVFIKIKMAASHI